MAALAVTNSFSAGTSIVASQMNTNFTDVVSWATGTPFLSASGSLTTVKGTMSVTELATFVAGIEIQGSNPVITFEGSTADAFETLLHITDPTADRTITLPDATGTVALTSTVIPSTLIDAVGDLIVGTADDTAGIIGVGSDTYVLTADSGEAKGIKWAAPTTGTVTSVTGTAPIVSSGGATPAISVTTNDAQLILNNSIFN